MLRLEQCRRGIVYRLHSRNLSTGVFDGTDGFIGIREKFGDRFLFKEFYNNGTNPFGTVSVLQEIAVLPDDIDIVENLDYTIDANTKRHVAFDKPLKEGGRGWYYVSNGESCVSIMPMAVENKKLFCFLDSIDYNS